MASPGACQPVEVAIEAVIFDYGGVLSLSPFGGLARLEERLGLAAGTLSHVLGFGLDVPEPAPGEPWTNKWHLLEIGAIDIDEYAEWVAARAEQVLGARIDLAARMGEGMGSSSMLWPMVHEARRLRREGLRTAICTNNVVAFRSTWETHLPLDDFDVVVDSSEVGLRKPDPAIYRLTAGLLGAAPERCAFLDDHPGNVAGAEAVGMVGIHVVDDDVVAAVTALRAAIAAS